MPKQIKLQLDLKQQSFLKSNKPESFQIKNIVEESIKQHEFIDKSQRKLINLNLKDDFIIKSDEYLMIFLLTNLLEKALQSKATEINIWLSAQKKHLYFKALGNFLDDNKIQIDLNFYQIAMKDLGGDIAVKFIGSSGLEFCFSF